MSAISKNSSTLLHLARLKRRALPLPFRLGVTSYVIPAGIVENVTALSDIADDIELVLFESGAGSTLPGPDDITQLGRIATESGLTYTVHLPLDLRLGNEDETTRQADAQECLRVAELARPLGPFAWIVHFEPGTGTTQTGGPAWKGAIGRSVEQLLASGIRPERFCVETLGYPFEAVEDIIAGADLSVCLDVGHVLVSGFALSKYIDRYGDRVRVVHLHGVKNGKDHCDLSHLDARVLSLLFDWLRQKDQPERVVTLEVFNEADLRNSLAAIERYIA